MEKARLTFLGTGTSQGVPIIGCRCEVCTSKDLRDKRFRASVLVEYCGHNILVDAGPDFRSQMLRAGVSHLDAILLTHNHRDHTGGLDDTRSLNYIDSRATEIFCEESVLHDIETEYPYAFAEPKYPGAPVWNIHLIDQNPFTVPPDSGKKLIWTHDVGYGYEGPDGIVTPCRTLIEKAPSSGEGAPVIPIRGYHDKMPVLGFRFGDIAYITDMSRLPEEESYKLKGLEHLTLNTVGYRKHHSHFSLVPFRSRSLHSSFM